VFAITARRLALLRTAHERPRQHHHPDVPLPIAGPTSHDYPPSARGTGVGVVWPLPPLCNRATPCGIEAAVRDRRRRWRLSSRLKGGITDTVQAGMPMRVTVAVAGDEALPPQLGVNLPMNSNVCS
jgi:hypothetical protein